MMRYVPSHTGWLQDSSSGPHYQTKKYLTWYPEGRLWRRIVRSSNEPKAERGVFKEGRDFEKSKIVYAALERKGTCRRL